MVDWVKRLWVVATSTLIGFISYSSQLFVIWPWYGSVVSVDLLRLLVPFNLLVGMVWWNYYLCVSTPPGHVPQGWRPNLQSADHIEVKRGSHAPRFCKQCEHFKPPRAHHCRQCKACVLKVNHCPWIANCVGYFNHGHFLRFLIWVSIATSFHLAMMVSKAYEYVKNPFAEPELGELLFLIFNFAASVPVWVCVGLFAIYHLYLVGNNTTTIERWEKDKVATLVRRGKLAEIKYPYNIGFIANIRTVLGDNPALWLWPQSMPGSGMSFPVNHDAGATLSTWYNSEVQYSWPPRDPIQYPNPPPPSGNAFVYGNGFNPALRASNGASRERRQRNQQAQERRPYSHANPSNYVAPWETDAEDDSEPDSSSSPERYLSDYDDDDVPLRAYTSATRVRRGSEGWEVRPAPGWSTGTTATAAALEDVERDAARPPWEQSGRYRTYVPEEQDH
ncbi:Palmitoyltransferase [Vanrija albida]|uniref:Palmitoyltransferase n=1 Tax=Vanrija albida TaxID=181172 RepID=A0ABR3Q8L8_9TREE